MCLDAPVTMLPQVVLIIPEWKLLNLGVFVEKMKAQCLLLPPDGQGAVLALPPANTHQAGETRGCPTAAAGRPNGQVVSAGETPSWRAQPNQDEPWGRPSPCPMGRWGLSAVLHLPSLHPSSGASASALFQAVPAWQYFFNVIFFIFVINVSLIEEEA